MLRHKRLLAGALALALTAPLAVAQPPAQAAPATVAVETISLSDSTLPLTGPWRFHPGDSPFTHDTPTWAEPGFADASWSQIQLPSSAAFREDLPGWMGQGFPQVKQGFAWYRLTVHVQNPGQSLWLKMPNAYDDAFQLYANGKLIGSAGFQTGQPIAYYSRPFAFPLPHPDAQGNITLALRFWLDPDTRFDTPTAGGLHRAPIIGLASTIRALQARDINALVLFNVLTEGVLPLFFLLAALAALWAWSRLRQETSYLWLGLRLLVPVAGAVVYDAAYAGKLAQIPATILLGVVIRSLLAPGWIVFWWHWFQVRRDRWILWITLALTLLDAASALISRAVSHQQLASWWSAFLSPLNTCLRFGELALLALILVKGFRRDRTEALLALVPVLINAIDIFNDFNLETALGWDAPVLGMYLPPSAIAGFVLVLIIGALSIRRFLAIHARKLLAQQAMEVELAQASELQKRVLLPGTGQSPSLQISTAYLPAQDLGGDFFQVLCNTKGDTLILLGDVSGKGVTAAFLVAVLVGTIRTRAEDSLDPVSMLHLLNTRLLDRSDGHFATCLALLVQESGHCTAVNAGHLPPYRNGEEVALSGSLPLGLVPDLSFDTATFQLNPGDQLTVLSDGVVEATDTRGNLFGFERAREISQGSASRIAAEARQHGQQDDITVLTVTYVGEAALQAA
jgi:hypothetical protein